VAGLVLRIVLSGVLLLSAALKAASPARTRAALATFGLRSERIRRITWLLLILTEALVAVGVAAGWTPAAYAGAVLSLGFAVALAAALMSGRREAPCGCFGPGSRVRPSGIARNLVLAAGFLLVAWLPEPTPSTEQWLALGLGVALAGLAALTVALLALARQVGELRLALPPQPALEIEVEGPGLGAHCRVIDRFGDAGAARFALAVFSSEGCPLCASLEPALTLLERDPLVELRSFDEVRDADAWREASAPGAPYAVAMDRVGTVLAKGTFNSLSQLESVLAAAERRAAEAERV
jgi:methylamine utilization protein MauE